MSDSGDDSPSIGKKKSSFASKFDKFSTKLHNPFKKSHSDSDDEGSSKTSDKSRNPSTSPARAPRGNAGLTRAEAVHNLEGPQKVPSPAVQV